MAKPLATTNSARQPVSPFPVKLLIAAVLQYSRVEKLREQFHLYETGQEHVPLTLEGVRAVCQAIPDDQGDEAAAEVGTQ